MNDTPTTTAAGPDAPADQAETVKELLARVPMPALMRGLPRNKVGYAIPEFVETVNGEREFRISSGRHWGACVRDRLCWVCGHGLPRRDNVFVLGPMCAVNRVTAEPPSHMRCARYSVQVCPFLNRPQMVRREAGLPETTVAGISIRRNPGVALLWRSETWRLFPDGLGQGGILFNVGEPVEWSWWCRGRPATRAEVDASIESGLPELRARCDGPADVALLERELEVAQRFLPAAA